MARSAFSVVVIAAALASGCSGDGPERAPIEGECRALALGGKGYRMHVPTGSAIEQDASRGSVLVRPNPNGRLVRFFSIALLAGATLPPPPENTTLANGLTLSYSIDENDGGSGGPEAELLGETLLDEVTPVMIVCHDQKEGGANAEWCLDYLATLEPAASPEACT